MDLTLRQLSVFASVARRLSFTAAAEDLRVSQSSLSRTVADIERVLGARMLLRDSRSVALTEEGQELLDVAEHVLGVHRAGMRRLQRFVDGGGGTVTVAALPSAAAVLLPPVVVAFRERWPGIDVAVRDGLSRAVLADLEQGRADLAITASGDGAPWLQGLPLVHDRFAAVVQRGHPLAERSALAWADLRPERFIALESDSSVRALTDAAFARSGGSPGPGTVEATSVATAGGLVAAGTGVTALPALVRALVGFAAVEHRPLEAPAVRRRLDVMWPVDRPLSGAALRFLQLLDELRAGAFDLPDDVAWAA